MSKYKIKHAIFEELAKIHNPNLSENYFKSCYLVHFNKNYQAEIINLVDATGKIGYYISRNKKH